MKKPLCLVVTPSGTQETSKDHPIDFDAVYRDLIQPAVEAAALELIRTDEATMASKPVRERLTFCDYAIADLTKANANVFYQLGIRQVVKPNTTIAVFSATAQQPAVADSIPSLAYERGTGSSVANPDNGIASLTQKLLSAKNQRAPDNSLYQLVDGTTFQNIVAHEKTDVFRDQVSYNDVIKEQLARAREKQGTEQDRVRAIHAVVSGLTLEDEETSVLIDCMLSYRAVSAFEETIQFIESMPPCVQQTIMVQEQLGLALNRVGKRKEALEVLENVVAEHGPSSETHAIIGRVYKDLFDRARNDGDEVLAEEYLNHALATYLEGFEADWRDAFPGINALTMLELKGQRQKLQELAPVVKYAVIRKMKTRETDYWDCTVLIEIAIFEDNEADVQRYLSRAFSCAIEGSWMLDTTIKTMRMIDSYRTERGEDTTLLKQVVSQLKAQKARFRG